MVAEARRPPILQQIRLKAITAVATVEIAVVHQDIERIGDTSGRVVHDRGIHAFEVAPRIRSEDLLGDAGDRVLRVACSLYIGKEEDPSIGFKPPPEFLGDAGLAHAPLSSQESVVAIANPRLEYLQFGLAIEKIVAADPAAGGGLHSRTPFNKIVVYVNLKIDDSDVNRFVVTRSVEWRPMPGRRD